MLNYKVSPEKYNCKDGKSKSLQTFNNVKIKVNTVNYSTSLFLLWYSASLLIYVNCCDHLFSALVLWWAILKSHFMHIWCTVGTKCYYIYNNYCLYFTYRKSWSSCEVQPNHLLCSWRAKVGFYNLGSTCRPYFHLLCQCFHTGWNC